MTEREAFLKMLAVVADLCAYRLSPEVARLYADHIAPHGLLAAAEALKRLMVDLKPGRSFPSVNDVLSAMGKTPLSDDAQARDTVSKIVQAISTHGYNWPHRARAAVGEIGWAIVHRMGGWETVCEDYTYAREKTVMLAQWRELAKALAERARFGELDAAPALPPDPDAARPAVTNPFARRALAIANGKPPEDDA